jgi:zinc finger protein
MSSTDGNNNKSADSTSSKSIFSKLDASESIKEENFGVTEIESICMTCFKNVSYFFLYFQAKQSPILHVLLKGVTKLMLTRIPFYRDVVISSFSCENCGFQNNSVESANKIQDKGVRIKLLVKDETDLNREMVKSDFATFRIPIIDFEIPPLTQKGCM